MASCSRVGAITATLALLAACSGATSPAPAAATGNDAGAGAPACTASSDSPTARTDVAGALDASGVRFVAFGGNTGAFPCNGAPSVAYSGETWVYALGCGWRSIAGDAPTKRGRHAMATDTRRDRALLFGGRTRPGTSGTYSLLGDVWAFDFASETWSQLQTTGTPPPARANTAMIVDTARDALVVFGGNTDATGLSFAPLSDLWSLDLATNQWTSLPQTNAPPARLYHAMAFDGANTAYVFSGGDANAFTGPFLHDVWSLDLPTAAWKTIATTTDGPGGRIEHGLAFDSAGKRLLAFGGHDDGDIGNENDVWALSVTAPSPAWTRLPGGDTPGSPSTGVCQFPADFTKVDVNAPERRSAFAFGARADGGAFFVFGGGTDCGNAADTWGFDVGASAWKPFAASPSGLSCLRVQAACKGLCG